MVQADKATNVIPEQADHKKTAPSSQEVGFLYFSPFETKQKEKKKSTTQTLRPGLALSFG
jgi:hypothetical protein